MLCVRAPPDVSCRVVSCAPVWPGRSEMRRGKKCVHLIYGDALAINAGSACYFLGQELLNQVDCSTDTKLRM